MPIIWFSKRKNSVEASAFESEFTEIINTAEIIETLRYKLYVFGVPINGSTNLSCDNRAVCVITTRPESTLSKKHHSIDYCCRQEAVVEVTVRESKEHTSTNLSDLSNNTIAAPKRKVLLDKFKY